MERVLLHILITLLSGSTPFCWIWAHYAPNILTHDINPFETWVLSILCYLMHGFLLEMVPLPPLQPQTLILPLKTILPQVLVNLMSSLILVYTTKKRSYHITDTKAILYLGTAALGNEMTYAFIHRLLHTKALYKYHHLHHKQRAPRPLGAAYCSLIEMWVANLASFLIPLSLTDAPIQIYLIWIICGIQTTQLHHSSKIWPWPFSIHQPQFHDDHHHYVCRNFGNIGIFEFALRKSRHPKTTSETHERLVCRTDLCTLLKSPL